MKTRLLYLLVLSSAFLPKSELKGCCFSYNTTDYFRFAEQIISVEVLDTFSRELSYKVWDRKRKKLVDKVYDTVVYSIRIRVKAVYKGCHSTDSVYSIHATGFGWSCHRESFRHVKPGMKGIVFMNRAEGGSIHSAFSSGTSTDSTVFKLEEELRQVAPYYTGTMNPGKMNAAFMHFWKRLSSKRSENIIDPSQAINELACLNRQDGVPVFSFLYYNNLLIIRENFITDTCLDFRDYVSMTALLCNGYGFEPGVIQKTRYLLFSVTPEKRYFYQKAHAFNVYLNRQHFQTNYNEYIGGSYAIHPVSEPFFKVLYNQYASASERITAVDALMELISSWERPSLNY
jgi:hypothetical protein